MDKDPGLKHDGNIKYPLLRTSGQITQNENMIVYDVLQKLVSEIVNS